MTRADMESAREAPIGTSGCSEPEELSAWYRVGETRLAMMGDQSRSKRGVVSLSP